MNKNDRDVPALLDTLPAPSDDLLSPLPIASRTRVSPNIILWNDSFSASVAYQLEDLMQLLRRLGPVCGILLHKEPLNDDGRYITFITIRAFLSMPQQGIVPVRLPVPVDWSTLKRLSESIRVVLESNADSPTSAASPSYFFEDCGRKIVIAYGNDNTIAHALKLHRTQRSIGYSDIINDVDVIETLVRLSGEIAAM
jgi:hypothetical protein